MNTNQPAATAAAIPIACDLTRIDPGHLEEHTRTGIYLYSAAVEETLELADGYALRFHAEEYPTITAFVANERLCCPFFHFNIDVAPAQGPIWLRITGPEGAKELFRDALQSIESGTLAAS